MLLKCRFFYYYFYLFILLLKQHFNECPTSLPKLLSLRSCIIGRVDFYSRLKCKQWWFFIHGCSVKPFSQNWYEAFIFLKTESNCVPASGCHSSQFILPHLFIFLLPSMIFKNNSENFPKRICSIQSLFSSVFLVVISCSLMARAEENPECKHGAHQRNIC